MTETSLCSLRNFHWVRWWVVFPNYLQTTSMPWLEGCQATSGADCSWRHTAQGDRVLRGRWGRIGGILTPRAKPRELFMLSDKFLLAHSWGTVSGITRFDCHMSIIAGWLARLFSPLFSFLSEWHYGGEKAHSALWVEPVILTGTQTVGPTHSTLWLLPCQAVWNTIRVDGDADLVAVSELMKTLCVTW